MYLLVERLGKASFLGHALDILMIWRSRGVWTQLELKDNPGYCLLEAETGGYALPGAPTPPNLA